MIKPPQLWLQRVSGILALALCVSVSLVTQAQQAPDALPNQSDSNQALLQRINELEEKVKQLQEKQVSNLAPPEPAVEQPTVNSVNDRLKLNVFGDVGYETTDLKPSTNTFEIGSLDLFMTAHLSDKVSALAEVLFVAADDNTISPDVREIAAAVQAQRLLHRRHRPISHHHRLLQHGFSPGGMVPNHG